MLKPQFHHILFKARGLTLEGIFDLLADAPFGAYAMTLDQRVLFWNTSAQRILGFASEEVIGRQFKQTLEPTVVGGLDQDPQDGCPTVLSLREGRVPARVQVRMQCASGDSKVIWIVPMVIAGATRDTAVLVHLFRDESAYAAGHDGTDWIREDLPHHDPEAAAPPASRETPPPGTGLTSREMEVLKLVALGWATPRIAEELNISPHTVLNHIRHFRRKLSAPTKLDAVVTAIRLGLLPVE